MAPSFIVTVSALLMFGPHVAALVAAAGALAPSFLVSERPYPRAHALIDAAVTVLATAAAGQAYQALTTVSTAVTGVWPWQAGLIAAAVLCYAVVQSALVAIVVPFVSRRPVNRSWPRAALRGCSGYLVGASVAAGLVALIDQRMWEVLSGGRGGAVLSLPHLRRLREPARRGAAPPRGGRVPRARHVGPRSATARSRCGTTRSSGCSGCSRDQALGRSLDAAAPAIARTELPKAIKDARADGKSRIAR